MRLVRKNQTDEGPIPGLFTRCAPLKGLLHLAKTPGMGAFGEIRMAAPLKRNGQFVLLASALPGLCNAATDGWKGIVICGPGAKRLQYTAQPNALGSGKSN